ncbi:hypothetical protein [Rheinheimera sp.]|uniref:hypothetical protein n=1 Tax=Rheinheimera sp. TaxID=1869214 RepID=UPI002732C30C|nr:hypothetical protein [Rheinheimera sp.]MDP2715782.1 hypothetical protein [Rheinheimera sp.]
MSENNIKPEKITKPIQLLAAWLAGLFSIDSCFLIGAANLEQGSFESIALVVAAIVNVPIFLAAVFLLQTKFRPELQEDSYYSTYLSQKTNQTVKVTKPEAQAIEFSHRISAIEKLIEEKTSSQEEQSGELFGLLVGVNDFLSDREKIKQLLAAHGASGISSFEGKDPPKGRVVAIAESLSNAKTHRIIQLAKEIGFTHYSRFDNWAEQTKEVVLFGSYGEPDYEII